MLALSRKKNESIVINNDTEITILEIKGDQVKIGITAPKSVPVYRKEVYLQIQESNEAASKASGMEALKMLAVSFAIFIIPQIAEWLIERIVDINYGLRDFIKS